MVVSGFDVADVQVHGEGEQCVHHVIAGCSGIGGDHPPVLAAALVVLGHWHAPRPQKGVLISGVQAHISVMRFPLLG
jgi:hypothetical protein